MKLGKRDSRVRCTEEDVDQIVVDQADDDSAWEEPIRVRKTRSSSVSIPTGLAERARFLAKLHRERTVQGWLTKIIRERVELEEIALREAKRDLSRH